MANLLVRLSILTLAALSIPSARSIGSETATLTDQGSAGPTAALVPGEMGTLPLPDPAPDAIPGGRRAATVLWHRHFDDPIYTSTGISEPSGLVLAGTNTNAPRQIEATPILGDGTADWTSAGINLYVDASRGGDVIAAVDFDAADSTATISEWRPDSPIPLWSYVVYPCRSLVYQGWASRKPIRVSDDGSTIAVGIVLYRPEGQRGNLFIFDAGHGSPVVDYDLPEGNIAAMELTPDGAFVALAGWPNVYVYDRANQSLRWSGSIYSGNDALAISGDGHYLAWGWSTIYLRQWNGSGYAPVWTYNPPGTIYVGQCALSADGSTFAVTWDTGNALPNETTVELYELPSLSMLWSYDYQGTPSTHVDVPSHMRFSRDGEYLAIASWGGDFPEIHLFERSDPDPLFTLDTPGSMFDIDITTAVNGSTHITACGKNVHAGTGGRGGDLYAIEIPGNPGAIEEAFFPTAGLTLEPAFPNPLRATTRVGFVIHRPGIVRLSVHDSQGRMVKKLFDHHHDRGTYSALWSGQDESGARVPNGIYLVRAVSGGEVQTSKILRLE